MGTPSPLVYGSTIIFKKETAITPSRPTRSAVKFDLNTPYDLSAENIQQFRQDGFIKLPQVFTPQELLCYGEEITRVTLDHNSLAGTRMEDRNTYDKAFIQVGNLWQKSDMVKELSFSPRMARIATELLGAVGIRMWHDQSLYKEATGGYTPWHADQQYWPMSSSLAVTAWIPLQETPLNMGPLMFARGSHLKNIGRDLEISDDSEKQIETMVKKTGLDLWEQPYAFGDVSFHYGWTLHRTGPNTTDKMRKVHTVIYMDEDMKLAAPKNQNQQNDWDEHTPSTKVGEIMADPINPVLYTTR